MELATAPAPADEPLRFSFPVDTELQATTPNENQILFKDADGNTALRYEQLYAHDAHGHAIPTELAWHGENDSIGWTIAHQGLTYPITIDPLITRGLGLITASDGAGADRFGSSVSLSDDTLAVGAPANGSQEQGAVCVFGRDQGGSRQWGEVRKLTASDGARSDRFGISVSLSGDTLAAGAHQDGNGSAYLFARHEDGTNCTPSFPAR